MVVFGEEDATTQVIGNDKWWGQTTAKPKTGVSMPAELFTDYTPGESLVTEVSCATPTGCTAPCDDDTGDSYLLYEEDIDGVPKRVDVSGDNPSVFTTSTDAATALVEAGKAAVSGTGGALTRMVEDAAAGTARFSADAISAFLGNAQWKSQTLRDSVSPAGDSFADEFKQGGALSALAYRGKDSLSSSLTPGSVQKIIDAGGKPVYANPVTIPSSTTFFEVEGSPGEVFSFEIGCTAKDVIEAHARHIQAFSKNSISLGAATKVAEELAPYGWISKDGVEVFCSDDSTPMQLEGITSREQIGWIQNDVYAPGGKRVIFSAVIPNDNKPRTFTRTPYHESSDVIAKNHKNVMPAKDIAKLLKASQTRTKHFDEKGVHTIETVYKIPVQRCGKDFNECVVTAMRGSLVRRHYAPSQGITITYDAGMSSSGLSVFTVTMKSTSPEIDEDTQVNVLAPMISQACASNTGMGRFVRDWSSVRNDELAYKQELRLVFPRVVTNIAGDKKQKKRCKITVTYSALLYLPVGVSK